MTTYTAKINPRQYARFMEKLGRRFIPTVKKGVLSGALRSLEVVRSNTENCPPASPNGGVGAVDTRHYLRGWKAQRTSDGAVVFNNTPYAGVIELGRRPGARQPPSHVFVPWLKHKLHVPESAAKGIAFLVARAIAKRGLEGRHILDASLPDIVKYVDVEITRELQKEWSKIP